MVKQASFEKGSVEQQLQELFSRSSRGDAVAYEQFLIMATVAIEKYLLHLVGTTVDGASIEDLTQEVIFSIHQKKHTYTRERPLVPWMYAIARYRFIDFYRQKKRLPMHLEWNDDYVDGPPESVALDLDELFGLMTPRQRAIFQLIKVEGRSYVEAADTLKMGVSSVKVSLHRLMQSLKGKVNR